MSTNTNAMTLLDAINNYCEADDIVTVADPSINGDCMSAEDAMMAATAVDDRNYIYHRNAIYRIERDGALSVAPAVVTANVAKKRPII